jgi:zinc protease
MTRPARLDHRPWRIVAFVLTGIATGNCGTAGSPQVAYVLPVHEYDLASGLRVAIEQADTAGTVGVAWVVDTGAADDPPGAPGVAHLVEHLALRSPDEDGVPLASLLANLGAAGINGMTAVDRTTFCAFAPRSALEEVVAAMATRLADPLRGADEALLAKEQMVVREELEMRRGVASITGLGLVMAALVPPTHPLAHIRDEVEAAARAHVSLEMARAFAARHYRPERMTLVISGAISPELGQRLLGELPPALQGRIAEPHAAVRRPLASSDLAPNPGGGLSSHAANVTAPELWMAWLLPPARGVEALNLEVLGGVVSRIISNLVNDGFLPDLAGLTPADLTAALAACRASAVISVVGRGPLAAVE